MSFLEIIRMNNFTARAANNLYQNSKQYRIRSFPKTHPEYAAWAINEIKTAAKAGKTKVVLVNLANNEVTTKLVEWLRWLDYDVHDLPIEKGYFGYRSYEVTW